MPLTDTMRWLESEKDEMGPSVLICSVIGLGVGTAVYLVSGWFYAIFAGLLTVGAFSILVDFLASRRFPKDARQAAESAIAAFEDLYPDCKLSSVALRAIEDDRYVFSIRYSGPNTRRSRPQARRYFAVSREIDANVVELDKSDWWPRGLK